MAAPYLDFLLLRRCHPGKRDRTAGALEEVGYTFKISGSVVRARFQLTGANSIPFNSNSIRLSGLYASLCAGRCAQRPFRKPLTLWRGNVVR